MRKESVKIELSLDKSHLEDVKIVNIGEQEMVKGDTLKITYKFDIEYFGNVASRLQAIINILEDKKVIKSINIEELNYQL